MPVPYIIKWYKVSDLLAHYLLVDSPSGGDSDVQLQADYQLPMLLDGREQALADFADGEPTCSKLVVGRSGSGKTSVALDILYRLHITNVRLECPELRSKATDTFPSSSTGHLNVLFVCKSKTLCASISKHFDDLCRPLGLSEHASPQEQFVAGRDMQAPCFVSSAELYVLLDSTLPQQARFFKTPAEATSFVRELSGNGDSLAFLERPETAESPSDAHGQQGSMPASLLTYERFCKMFESSPLLSKQLRVLGLSIIYREIFSYIKGSAAAMHTRDKRMHISDGQPLSLHTTRDGRVRVKHSVPHTAVFRCHVPYWITVAAAAALTNCGDMY